MRRSTLILLIVLAVLVIGGGVYAWLMRDSITWPWSGSTTTNTTSNANSSVQVVTNTATVTNTSLPSEVKGDTAVSGTLTLANNVTVTISSQQKTDTNNGATAAQGKTFLLVYFDAVAPTNVLAVDQGLRSAKVVNGDTNYALEGLKVASTAISGDRGYLQFTIVDSAKNLQLVLGTQTVDLK